jgi:hypothetical protein
MSLNAKSRLWTIWICCLLFSCNSDPQTEAIDLPEQISFNFDIRPILSDNCYVCHGPDSSTRQAELRLDLREVAIHKLADGKSAIVPGNWKKSELIRRVTSTDPELMMPPPEMKRQLNKREIALLKRWIDEGANWEPYWAFIPPSEPQVPSVDQKQYINNQIDNFLVQRLESKALEPAQVADKNTLARRLSFILTGLPPELNILDSFTQDTNTQAYEELVDYYLASPHFGEHWARHWMDLVRYADTRGHEFDYKVVGAWQYRDYLIRAFNQDVPYNQLIMEQLAGDLLTKPRLNVENGFDESVIGTAFYGLTEGKHSPVDLKIDQSERIDNIIDVTSKTFQALTVACAKCHDHKFDPIPTTDYYSMYGMVESTRFTVTPVNFDAKSRLVFDSLKADQLGVRRYIAENIENPLVKTSNWKGDHADLSAFQVIGDFRDGSLDEWIQDGYSIENTLGQPIIQGQNLVGLETGKVSNKAVGKGLYGALRSPGFVISTDSMLFRAAGNYSMIRVVIDNFQLIQDPIYGQLKKHLNNEELQDYKIDVSMWKGHRAYVELLVGDYLRRKDKDRHDFDLDPEAWLEVEYLFGFDSLPNELPIVAVEKPGNDVSELLVKWHSGQANAIEIASLNKWLQIQQPRIAGLRQWVEVQQQRKRQLYDSSFVVSVMDGDYIESPVFIRGSLKNLSQQTIPHRFLTALSDTSMTFRQQGSGRLEFAKKIANPDNPLTGRVMVNRLWHHIFGRGIVETVDNFGVQGKIPSHPELLDYLAVKLVEEDWSLKKMIKYMVMSQAFQRSTNAAADSKVVDPDNLLLQHYPIRRLNAESIRDAVLATSGSLDRTLYGPTVPVYLTEFLSGRGRPRKSGPLDGAGRRSIYQALHRNFLPPMMLAFDMPVPFSTFGRRNVSNVPSQSLTMLNDPFVSEQASLWAASILMDPAEFEDRIGQVFLKAFSRPPSNLEIDKARTFFEEQQALLSKEMGAKYLEEHLWKSYCHTIFNMKEFIFLI